MGVEREIVKHMRLCASLMSDPDVMRENPEIVANQFRVAKSSIELLNQFLVPKAATTTGDPCCDCNAKGWLDSSIISNGIGKLVEKTLRAHMDVVIRKEADFPRIVREDFRPRQGSADVTENYLIREMKETNCMGSIILLYYYLYWYLLLILLNKRNDNDPSYCNGSELDIVWLINNLPGMFSFLEFRHFGGFFTNKDRKTITDAWAASMKKTDVALQFMFSSNFPVDGHDELKRKGLLVAAYRRALATNLGCGIIDEAGIDLPELIHNKGSMYIYNLITSQTVVYGMSVMGGMAPEYESQDATQKWKDMDNVVQVLGYKSGSRTKLTGKLIDILSCSPYSKDDDSWKEKGTMACLLDYCSAALMMDICRSFQKLAEAVCVLLEPSLPEKTTAEYMIAFLAEMSLGSLEKCAVRNHIRSKPYKPDYAEFLGEEYNFINKTDSTWSEPETILALGYDKNADHYLRLWVDKFKNLYPSKTANFTDEINHRCFNWDIDEKNNCDPLFVMQHEWKELTYKRGAGGDATTPFCNEYSVMLVGLFLSNSWIISYGLYSVDALMKKIHLLKSIGNISSRDWNLDTKDFVPQSSYDQKNSMLHNMKETGFHFVEKEMMVRRMMESDGLKLEVVKFQDAVESIVKIVEEKTKECLKTPVKFSDITKYIILKQKLLTELAISAKSFKKYPALMWPVMYKFKAESAGNNEKSFKEVSRRMESVGIPKTFNTTQGTGNSLPSLSQAQALYLATSAAQTSAESAERAANDVREIAETIRALQPHPAAGGAGGG